MSDKAEQLEQLDQAHEDFRDLVSGLPREAYEEEWLGKWNLTHLLAHMAGWWREMTPAFNRVAEGQRPVPEGVSYDDADSWNEKFAANPQPADQALEDWEQAFREYRAGAAALGEDFYGIDPEKGRPRIGNRLLAASGINHFEEHHEQVAQWINSRES